MAEQSARTGAVTGLVQQDIDRYLGMRVRERRVMLGLTQQQLAELIGVTYQQAHKYEKGTNRVAAGRLYISPRRWGSRSLTSSRAWRVAAR